jgi:CRP-like cAMP-binding protein
MYPLLRAFLAENMKDFTDTIFAEISVHFTTKKVKRGEKLVKAGNLMRWLYFVNSGCLRTYHMNALDDEITVDFALEGSFNIVTPEFLLQEPGDYYIHAIETSELLTISNSSFEHLSLKYYAFHQCIFYMTYQRREEVFRKIKLHKSAETYTWLKKQKPWIIERIPDKFIASYLGMSKRTFIRAKAGLKK